MATFNKIRPCLRFDNQSEETQRNSVMKVVMASLNLDIAKLKEAYNG